MIVEIEQLLGQLYKCMKKDRGYEDFSQFHVVLKGSVQSFYNVVTQPELQKVVSCIGINVSVVGRSAMNGLNHNDFISKYDKSRISGEEEIDVSISINKELDIGVCSSDVLFFEIESFDRYFRVDGDHIVQYMVKSITANQKIRLFLPLQDYCQNSFMSIAPLSSFMTQSAESWSEELKITWERISKHREDITKLPSEYPIPHFFEGILTKDKYVKQIIDRNLFVTSLAHLSNKIEGNKYVVRGGKTTELELDYEFKPKEAQSLFKLFDHTYDLIEKHTQAKVLLVRNVISTYLHEETIGKLEDLLPKIKSTTDKNFDLYTHETIKKFNEELKEHLKEAHKFATDIRGETDKVSSSINTAMLGVITAAFTGVIGVSKGERWFLVIAYFSHVLYFWASYKVNIIQSNRRKKEIKRTIKNYVELVEVNSTEWAKLKKTYIFPALVNLIAVQRSYKRTSIVLAVVMLLAGIAGLCAPKNFFGESSSPVKQSNVSTSPPSNGQSLPSKSHITSNNKINNRGNIQP